MLNNVNVWSLGPPGSSQHDLAKTLQYDSLRAEDGFDTKINRRDVRIIMIALAYLADMPQQNKLAGVKSPLATHGCRSCMVSMKQLGDPTIDIPFIARYETTVQVHKAWINKPNILAGEKEKRAVETGLQDDRSPFAPCHRCFDPFKYASAHLPKFFYFTNAFIRLQPNEPIHAEIRLNKYFHAYLMEVVFTPAAHKEYLMIWDKIEIPHG